MSMFSLPFFHIYLLQLENYNLVRCWRSAINHGVSVPSSFQVRNVTWTAKLLLVTIGAVFFVVGIPTGLLLFLPISESVVAISVLVFLLTAGWFLIPLSVATLLVRPVDRAIRFLLIQKAKRTLATRKDATVIGVTGSYGKTTMKQTLQTLLADRLDVVATPESYNKPVSVARFLLSAVTDSTEVVIIEMGAYQRGDIADLCALAQPDISVLCGINEAHLERFGSMENTIQSKFEIVTEAKSEAAVILNADDEQVSERYEEFVTDKQAVSFYSARNDKRCPYEIRDKRFHKDGSGWSFRVYKDGEEIGYTKVPHLGEYIIGNVVAGLLVGGKLGVDPQPLLSAATKITPAERRLQPIQRTTDSILVIDDSYNGTLDGVQAALDTLDRFVGRRKVVVTTGLVEMGEKSEEIHKKIGRRLAQTADVVVLVETSVTNWIKAGLKSDDYSGEVYTFKDRQKMQAAIDDITVSGDVVLFQNDWPESYR